MNYYVYIITNVKNTVLYVGMTNNLQRRMYEHKNKLVEGFSSKYNLCKLVYYATTTDVTSAIACEKKYKHFTRKEKENLINGLNPDWKDLSLEF